MKGIAIQRIFAVLFPMILVVVVIILSWVGFIIFSYFQTTETLKAKTYHLWTEQQAEVTEAWQQFQHYQNLMEFRLLNSLGRKEAILRILDARVEHVINKHFPMIMGLTFVSSSEPNVKYTRFGKQDLDSQKEEIKAGVQYLGQGLFKINKLLHNTKQKAFGILQSTISIKHLLSLHFPESEISIFAEQMGNVPNNLFSFTIKGLPYIFVLNRSLPTFWQFLYEFKFQIFSILLFGTLLLFIGLAIGVLLRQRILFKQWLLIQKKREKRKELESKNINLINQLKATQHLLTLEKTAEKTKNLLWDALQDRYRQMTHRAQAINMLTSKLISERAGKDRLAKEVHSISQESNTILRRLSSGYPMKEIEESVDVLQSIQNIKSIFLPQIVTQNIIFEISGKIKKLPTVDQIILEIVLHNIFNIVMNRLLKDNVFKITFKGIDPLHILFYDNGYDIEEKIHTVKNNAHPQSILYLDKRGLREFISYLGWRVHFQNEEGLLNSIKLSIPLILNKEVLPDNVVNLFDS